MTSLPRAAALLWRSPSLWLWALVPTLVFALLFAVGAAVALLVARPWLVERLPHATSDLGRFGVSAASYGFVALLVVVGWFVALLLAPPLSAPALEALVAAVEARTAAPPRAPLGFVGELLCGFRSLLGAALVALPLYGLLWLVEVVLPAAAPLTMPLAATLSALLVAWSLFDYPLTLRGMGFRERLRLMQRNFGCVVGFGVAFGIAFWLPCCGVVLLPVGALAATDLFVRIQGWERPPNAR